MASILKSKGPSQPWGHANALFLHNWRCAGSTLNSLLASNFTDHYLKVGMAFDSFGWPDPSKTEFITLADLRSSLQPGCIVGGHLFMGLEALLPGPWQIWMNAREPLGRLRSGILRFHASGAAQIRDQDLMKRTSPLESQADLEALLAGPLRREGNGLCRRLAGLSASDDFVLDAHNTNLEQLPFLESDIPAEGLLKLASANLGRVSILLLSEYLQASILCLETVYNLRPFINPFSDLRHNPVTLGKPQPTQIKLLKNCEPILQRHAVADLQLWPLLQQRFQKQLSTARVAKRDIRIRELIHSKPLIDLRWMRMPVEPSALIKAWAGRIAERALQEPELGERLIDTVCSWYRLEDDAADQIHHFSHQAFRAGR